MFILVHLCFRLSFARKEERFRWDLDLLSSEYIALITLPGALDSSDLGQVEELTASYSASQAPTQRCGE